MAIFAVGNLSIRKVSLSIHSENLATEGVYVLTFKEDTANPCSTHIGSRTCNNQHHFDQPQLAAESAYRAQARWNMSAEFLANERLLNVLLLLAARSVCQRDSGVERVHLQQRVLRGTGNR